MTSVATKVMFASALVMALVIRGGAQAQKSSGAAAGPDPRVGLKAGFRDAGVAARNLELVTSVSKPEGFYDPSAPSGGPLPPEPPAESAPAAASPAPAAASPAPAAAEPAPATQKIPAGLNFA